MMIPSWAIAQDSDNHFSHQQSFSGSTLHALPTQSGMATPKSIASQAREEQSVAQALSVTVKPAQEIYSIGDTVEIVWEGTQQNDSVKIEMWRNGTYVKTIADNFTGANRYTYIWEKGDEGEGISFVVTINTNTFTKPLLHSGKINSIDWSNDDVEILTTGGNVEYCIYDNIRNQVLANRVSVGRVTGSEPGFIKNAIFHPQDKTKAAISIQYPSDSRVFIGLISTQLGWSSYDYNSLITTSTDYLPIDFSPDGQHIISCAGNVCRKYQYEFKDTVFIVDGVSRNGTMSRLYNVSSFNVPFGPRTIFDIKYTPYGDSIVVVGSESRIGIPELPPPPTEMAFLVGNVDGKVLKNAFEDIGYRNLASVAWNNSGTYCVSSDMHRRDSQIIIRNNSLQLHKFLIGATGVVSQVDWSKDGKFIASVDGDGYLVLWNENGELLKKHRIGIRLTAVKFSNDSRKIAIGDTAGNVYIINNIPLFATGTSHPSMTDSTSRFDVAMPEWKAENTDIDFGGVYTDETGERTITLRNTGKVPLIINEMSDLPSDSRFSWIDKPTPPIILQTGEGKNFRISFAPQTIQSYGGTFTMRATIAKTQQITFNLFGEGIDPRPNLTQYGANPIFSPTACSKVKGQLTIVNTGRDLVEVRDIIVDNPFSIDEGTKPKTVDKNGVNIYIWYDPNQGEQSQKLTIKSNAKNGDLQVNLVPNKQTVLYSFTQNQIDVGDVCLGSNDIKDVTLKQDGTFSPTIRIEGDVNDVVPQQLLSSGDITFSLPLQFDTPGTFTKTITAKNNECEDYSQNITITGYAGTPKLTIVDPPQDTLRSDAEEEIVDTIIIKNEGDIAARLTMDAAQFSPFTLKNSVPNSLKKDESVAIIVSYIPKEEGEIIADKSLRFLHHCDVKPLEIPLRGESYRDDPEIVSEDIHFGEQLVGYESAPRNLIIRNKSNKKAMFTAKVKEISSAISISYLPKLEINAGDSIAIPVVFKPEQKGVFSAGIDLRRDGNSTKTRVRAKGTGIERDSLRDKLITLLLENRNIKGKKITAKDIIDIELRALSNEIDSALAAFNNAEYFPYSIDILWNPRLLALANIDEEMTEFKNGSGVTIKGKISRDMNKTGAFSTVKKLRFEVLWGEINTKDSIAIGSIHIDTTDITSAIQARLWTPASEVVYLDYDPTCVSGFVRGATYREDLEIITIPNPSLGITSVYLSEIAARDHSKLEIYSHYGLMVHELSFVGNTIDIDMSHYSSGQYTVIAKTPRGIARTMVILIK